MDAFDITINGINFTEISHLAAELDSGGVTEAEALQAADAHFDSSAARCFVTAAISEQAMIAHLGSVDVTDEHAYTVERFPVRHYAWRAVTGLQRLGLLGDVPSYALDELAELMSEDDGGYQVTLDDLQRWHDEDNGSERVTMS